MINQRALQSQAPSRGHQHLVPGGERGIPPTYGRVRAFEGLRVFVLFRRGMVHLCAY